MRPTGMATARSTKKSSSGLSRFVGSRVMVVMVTSRAPVLDVGLVLTRCVYHHDCWSAGS